MFLTQGLHRAVQRSPDAVATICEGRVRTFRELALRVSRLGGGLAAMGVRPGDRVAILAANSDRYLEFLLAVAWIGAVSTPLNTRWNAVELADAMDDSGVRVLVMGPGFETTAETLRERCTDLVKLLPLGAGGGGWCWDSLAESAEPMGDVRRGGDELAMLVYTGGTTGRSKGVMLSHRNLLTSALGSLAAGDFLSPGGSLLTVAPLFHLAGVWPWLAQNLLGGAHVVLGAFTPEAVVDAIVEHEVTDTLLVPVMLQAVVDHLEASERRLPGLRHLIYAGSSITESLLTRARAVLPTTGFVQGYGMTETAPVATLLLPAEHSADRLRSAGRAAPHSEVRILDADGTEAPRGRVGEIVVYGDQVMLGYWNQPELTRAALHGGGMHTGDAGYMDVAGYVHVVDRLKDMIITGGENVYSAEVENTLSGHPAVLAVAVIALPDEDWGERVHAVVVPRGGVVVTLEQLRDHCASRIARYKLPRSLDLVEELPVSAAGKVLKQELRRRYDSTCT